MDVEARQTEHSNLYYIFQQDQSENPMPAERAQEMLNMLRRQLASRACEKRQSG